MKAAPAKLSKNQVGVQAMAKTMSVLILVAGVIYCEVMFLSMVATAFPTGILRIFASIGAIVGGMSVLLLLLAKSFWFTEGVQLIFSYVFTGFEVVFLIANTVLAFELNSGKTVDSWLAMWETFAPATPVVAIVGWTIIWALDASAKRRHALTNIEDEEHEAELDYRRKVHQARIGLRDRFLAQVIADMEEDIQSDHIRGQGRVAASQLAAAALTEVTGVPVVPRLGSSSSAHSSESIVPASGYSVPTGALPATSRPRMGLPSSGPGGSDWDLSDQWLSQVNERVEQERARRLASEGGRDPVTAAELPYQDMQDTEGGDTGKKK